MKYQEFFKNKKVILMGLGLLGRGVGDAKFLAACGAKLTITDLKTKKDLIVSIKKLKKFKNIKFILGKHRLSDFRNADMVIKGAGVPLNSPFIKEALNHKVPVYMSTSLFAKFFKQIGGKIIGITGTRGKTTTTSLIYHILNKSGQKAFIGGNIQGKSTLSMIEKIKPDSIVVLELDSWQLQGFGYEKISPDIAVFTNLYPDHMNYYKNNMSKYLHDKANIFLWQKKGDYLILGEKISAGIKKRFRRRTKSQITVARPRDFKDVEAHLIGQHNKENIACAIRATEKLGLPSAVIKKSIRKFKGVKGRLECIAVKDGVRVYNDTTSTTPEASIAALESLADKKKRVILICGGSDKGLNMDKFIKEVRVYSKKTILLSGTGTERIKSELGVEESLNSLGEAVREAFRYSKKGDIILFSPAFASFGMFKNEYDRGSKFEKIVKCLISKK